VQRRYPTMTAMLTLLLVSGCSQSGAGFAVLEEPATVQDQLSVGDGRLEDSALQDLEPDSARFLAEHEGISYFLASPVDPGMAGGVCIVAVEAGVTGCFGPGNGQPEMGTVSFEGQQATAVRDGANVTGLTDDGWTRVHDNLLVR
jgi:hypothetical protein